MLSTSTPDNTKYEWLDSWVADLGGAITLTLTGIGSPEEFLELVGAQRRPSEDEEMLRGVSALAGGSTLNHVLVGVTPAPGRQGWVLGAESPACVSYEKASELSIPGRTAVAFHCTEESGASLIWAEDGVTLAELSLTDGDAIDGSDQQRLWEKVREAGLDTDDTTHPCATAATLIEAITSVVITRKTLEETKFTSGSVPFPYW
jgi:Family of unknown function (DUF6461)